MQRSLLVALALAAAPLLVSGCSGAGGGTYDEGKAKKAAEESTGYYNSPSNPSAMPASPGGKAPTGAPSATPGAAPSATP